MGTAAGGNMTKSTSIGGDMCSLEKTDGSQSDTAVGLVGTVDKKRRSSIGAKMAAVVGLSRKSRSASQLSQTGQVMIIVMGLFPFIGYKDKDNAYLLECHHGDRDDQMLRCSAE
ncbi:regulating synaptic membrane exocytosis 2-like protein [Labeo rohita]|uniref:Regulating synaptic membrane exocytosis 2-like protein n=1 Tax=Labeo rohita TaxID=84645 RepID=A0A498L8S0_LABRO|nr:regulating synaptic membrane exocytosis 2-like protein [Labeo rohita]